MVRKGASTAVNASAEPVKFKFGGAPVPNLFGTIDKEGVSETAQPKPSTSLFGGPLTTGGGLFGSATTGDKPALFKFPDSSSKPTQGLFSGSMFG